MAAETPDFHQPTARLLMYGGVVAFLLTTFGTQLMTAHSWADMVTPMAVGKNMLEIGTALAGIFGARKLQ